MLNLFGGSLVNPFLFLFPIYSHFPQFLISQFPIPISHDSYLPFPITQFPIPHSNSPFPISQFPNFPFPIPHFPFPITTTASYLYTK